MLLKKHILKNIITKKQGTVIKMSMYPEEEPRMLGGKVWSRIWVSQFMADVFRAPDAAAVPGMGLGTPLLLALRFLRVP